MKKGDAGDFHGPILWNCNSEALFNAMGLWQIRVLNEQFERLKVLVGEDFSIVCRLLGMQPVEQKRPSL